jgi:hypothetical protein
LFKKIMGFLTDLLGAGRKAGFWTQDQSGVVPKKEELPEQH